MAEAAQRDMDEEDPARAQEDFGVDDVQAKEEGSLVDAQGTGLGH